MNRITVFTATFNRREKLRRAFESLQNQSCTEFEWLIIDDGSSDGTDKLVDEMKKDSRFPIRYYWKENGGRHTAVNYSHDKLRTEYVVTLDSDDELVPDAIEKMLSLWDSIPQNEYDRYWCVSGRWADASTGQIVGALYPEGINELRGKKQRRQLLKIDGE